MSIFRIHIWFWCCSGGLASQKKRIFARKDHMFNIYTRKKLLFHNYLIRFACIIILLIAYSDICMNIRQKLCIFTISWKHDNMKRWPWSSVFMWFRYELNIFALLRYLYKFWQMLIVSYRADSMFAPSQWETGLLCNDVSHWLDASLKSALFLDCKGKSSYSIVIFEFHSLINLRTVTSRHWQMYVALVFVKGALSRDGHMSRTVPNHTKYDIEHFKVYCDLLFSFTFRNWWMDLGHTERPFIKRQEFLTLFCGIIIFLHKIANFVWLFFDISL